jgi:D-glycero-D-manno-heptose 1,7-bisphosphate phosphatase
MPGAADAVARARNLGLAVLVASNQSGVGRGLFTEDAVHAVNRHMDELLVAENPAALIDVHYFCPYHPAAALPQYRIDSDLRKPKPGMILEGLKEMSLQGGFCIGDAPRDIAAGAAAGLTTILFTPPDVPPSPASEQPLGIAPDYRVSSLQEAMDIIERLTTARPAPKSAATEASSSTPPSADLKPIERQLDLILTELKRHHVSESDFSVSRLMAGIVQVLAIATLLMAYLNVGGINPVLMLLLAVFLQTFVTSLLLMSRSK